MRSLAVMRGLAVVAVVLNHATGFAIVALVYWGHRFGSQIPAPDRSSWVSGGQYLALLALSTLPLASVPLFAFAAGWFVSYAERAGPAGLSRLAVRRWLATLLWPWVIWLIASVAIAATWCIVAEMVRPTGDGWSIGKLIYDRALSFYYGPVMVILFVVAPVLVSLARRCPSGLVVGAALVQLLVVEWGAVRAWGYGVPAWLNVDWLGWMGYAGLILDESLRLGLFFVLGLVVSRDLDGLRLRLAGWRGWVIVLGGIFAVSSMIEADTVYRGRAPEWPGWQISIWTPSAALFAITVIMLLATWEWPKNRGTGFLERLGAASYAVYLMQFVCIEYSLKVIYHVAPGALGQPTLLVPVLACVGLGGPLLLMGAVARTPLRRFYQRLFGMQVPTRRRSAAVGAGARGGVRWVQGPSGGVVGASAPAPAVGSTGSASRGG